jgi:hypothetical protein
MNDSNGKIHAILFHLVNNVPGMNVHWLAQIIGLPIHF